MMDALNKKGYSAFSLCVPSPSELLTIFGLAAPVFITMMSKVTTSDTQLQQDSLFCIWYLCFIPLGFVLYAPCVLCYINGYKRHSCSSGDVLLYRTTKHLSLFDLLVIWSLGYASDIYHEYGLGGASLSNCTVLYAWVVIRNQSQFA